MATSAFRGLQLLRHAKSDWHANSDTDMDRPLSRRGRRAARAMATWMADADIHPDIIYTSPAKRARQTLDVLGEQLELARIEVYDGLYHADLSELLSILGQIPREFAQVMLLGHNPGLETLLTYLVADDLDQDKTGKVFPTAAFAHIAVTCGRVFGAWPRR